jgi:prepilin-type processing-associated H-X9-DG protein
VEAPIDATNHGVFFLNSWVRYEDVSDGSSHTIFVGEKLTDPWDMEWVSGTRGTLRNMGTPINSLNYSTGLPRPNGSPYDEKRSSLMPDPLSIPELDDGAAQEKDSAGGAAPAKGGPALGPGNPLFVGGFGSCHPQGAQFAFGDGHVRFINQMATPAVLSQLGHRADGKLPPSDF